MTKSHQINTITQKPPKPKQLTQSQKKTLLNKLLKLIKENQKILDQVEQKHAVS